MSRCIAIVLATSLVCAAAPVAHADPKPRSRLARSDAAESARAKARELATRGALHYNVGRFREALEDYRRAYELYPAPGLLFNQAQCHSKLRNWDLAIFQYRAYLQKKPDASNRAVAEELLRDARVAQRMEQRWCPGAADLDRFRAAPVDDPSSRKFYDRWWFWTTVGVIATSSIVILDRRL